MNNLNYNSPLLIVVMLVLYMHSERFVYDVCAQREVTRATRGPSNTLSTLCVIKTRRDNGEL